MEFIESNRLSTRPDYVDKIMPGVPLGSPEDMTIPKIETQSKLSYQNPAGMGRIGANKKIPTGQLGEELNPEALGYLYLNGRKMMDFMPQLFNVREQYT